MKRMDTEALALLRTPFHWGGRAPGVGLDCAGVIVSAAALCGSTIQDYKGYGANTDPDAIMNRLIPQMEPIAVDDAQPGDVLVFWLRSKDRPAHIGILAEDGQVIHAHKSAGACVREPMGSWRRHVFGAYRIIVDVEVGA